MGYWLYAWLYILTHSWLGAVALLVIIIVVLLFLPAMLTRREETGARR
jgi:hypothetical protein